MRVWVHYLPCIDASSQASLGKQLQDADMECCPLAAAHASEPGIVFFSKITEDLCTLIRRASRTGLCRVFAIAVPGSNPGHGAWRLLEAGAAEVFAWDRSSHPAADIAARLERWKIVDALVEDPCVKDVFIGHGPAWSNLARRIVELGRFTAANILLLGESGTGKELVARLLHALDARDEKGGLVVLDCTTIVPELSGSEFFGHERGAFTGASQARDGAFALADHGTLFLDEVGELPLSLQGQLLRAVQERTYKRVGGNAWHATEFRLVCATNKDLRDSVRRGEFRHDLYYRVANWTLTLPPLRERAEDILPLARHFVRQLRPDRPALQFDDAVAHYLRQRDYPGNIRELKHIVSRIADRHVGDGPVTAGDIPEDDRPSGECPAEEWRDHAFERAIRRALASGVGLKEIGRAAEETAVSVAITEENGSLQRAATRLGVTDRALQMRRASASRILG